MTLERELAPDILTKDAIELTARVSSRRLAATARTDSIRASSATLADMPADHAESAISPDANPEDAMVNISQLPPVDKGFGAWSFVR